MSNNLTEITQASRQEMSSEMFFKKLWYRLIRMTPDKMEMVAYWKFTDKAVAAKLMRGKYGYEMKFANEKEIFPGFPRGHLLIQDANGKYSPLTRLKHEIKNQIFNESWAMLEQDTSHALIIQHIKDRLFNQIEQIGKELEYDYFPPNQLSRAVREIHRAWTKVAPPKTYILRDYLCLILQEDDGYRFRVQWLVKWFRWLNWNPVKTFDYALSMMEHGEVVGDMKDRMKLLHKVLMLALEDKTIRELFIKFFKEVKWSEVKLRKADKFHFRGKYFKVDYPELTY